MKCVCLPEWSSLTSEDTVLVMESAATRRSFLRFLLGPEGQKQAKLETLYYRFMQICKDLNGKQYIYIDSFI